MSVSPLSLPPKDAIAFFRAKGLAISFDYRDVWQAEHARAFTVAKAMSVDVLEDIRAALDEAQTNGTPFETFRKQLAPILQARGWWGRQDVVDPQTGQTVRAQLGSDRRLRIIFDTNMRQAFNAGNWQRQWANRHILPYLVYHHNADRYPRPEHQAWDGVCLPVEHSWWKTHYPQCAWGCKCSVTSASRAMLDKMGLKPTPDDQIPRFPVTDYVNPRTGEVSQVEQGIDPAFNFNIGASPFRPITARPLTPGAAMPTPEKRQSAPAAGPPPAHAPLSPAVTQAAVEDFLAEFGATPDKPVIRTDKTGWPIAVGEDLFRDGAGQAQLPRPELGGGVLGLIAKALKLYDSVETFWGRNAAGKAVIVRRYIKRLDNQIITVDFADGVWSYDIKPAPSR